MPYIVIAVKINMLYDMGCKFIIEISEIRALSVYFHLNKLHSLLIKTVFLKFQFEIMVTLITMNGKNIERVIL